MDLPGKKDFVGTCAEFCGIDDLVAGLQCMDLPEIVGKPALVVIRVRIVKSIMIGFFIWFPPFASVNADYGLYCPPANQGCI